MTILLIPAMTPAMTILLIPAMTILLIPAMTTNSRNDYINSLND